MYTVTVYVTYFDVLFLFVRYKQPQGLWRCKLGPPATQSVAKTHTRNSCFRFQIVNHTFMFSVFLFLECFMTLKLGIAKASGVAMVAGRLSESTFSSETCGHTIKAQKHTQSGTCPLPCCFVNRVCVRPVFVFPRLSCMLPSATEKFQLYITSFARKCERNHLK